jgi:hypothetical protein
MRKRTVTFLLLWGIHALIALVLASPILFLGRNRATWEWWELLYFVVPFSVRAGLMLSDLSVGESLANLGECIYLSFASPLVALGRLAIGRTSHRRVFSAGLLAFVCITAAGVFFLTPPLPE